VASFHNKAIPREKLRKRYRPTRVRVLFVGESPPASGRFFYQEDSGLYRAVRDTFLRAMPSLRDADFLQSFRELGCYLVDLCGEPVDHLRRDQRAYACQAGEARLRRTIQQLKPEIIVTVVRSIAPNVRRVLARADWKGQHLELPYPGRWLHHRTVFEKELIPVLRVLIRKPRR
jgi:Uracil DNA glycosylase superfamily